MKTVTVQLPGVAYDIQIERGLLQKAGEEIKKVYKGTRVYIVTDTNVAPLYLQTVKQSIAEQGYETFSHVIQAGEESKSFAELQGIYHYLIENGASRKDLLVALGGGVIGDMTGFAAASYMRGIAFVQIPTSLLAQIDSSIGGKVAVNLPEGKNLVGAFYHPKRVIIDPDCLNTLPQRVLSDGAAEALKTGYIKDPALYDIFQKLTCPEDLYQYIDEIIYRCCDVKRGVVERDEKEQGERMILNFGHTVGHAYESYYHYQKYTHGEAVALGMMAICQVSEIMGKAPKGVTADLKKILEALHLPTEDKEGDKEVIVRNILKDKKSNSQYTNVVLLEKIGTVMVENIPSGELTAFFKKGGFLA